MNKNLVIFKIQQKKDSLICVLGYDGIFLRPKGRINDSKKYKEPV